MTTAGESSSAASNDKPLVVRVKRKASQSRLEALWLEINERPVKRPLLDFGKLSISDSSGKDEFKSKKVLVQHVETIRTSETTIEIVRSILPNSDDASEYKAKGEDRRHAFKKENKQDQLLSKARQRQEVLAKNARFEQIWRSRKGDKEAVHGESLHEMCQFYDVVRVDVDEKSSGQVQKQEDMSLEDQRLLSSYLPLLREFIPSAATEIESDISGYISKQAATDDYVYDYYIMKNDRDITDENAYPFPSVQVDDDDFYCGLDEPSEDESYDSNAEDHPFNDYPDEESDEDGEEDEEDDEDDEEDEDDDVPAGDPEETESASSKSLEPEVSLQDGFSGSEDYYDDYTVGLEYGGNNSGDFDYYDDDAGPEDWR